MEIKFKNVTFSSKIGLKDRDYVSYFYSKKQGQFLIFPIFSTSKPNVSYKPVSYKSNLRVFYFINYLIQRSVAGPTHISEEEVIF